MLPDLGAFAPLPPATLLPIGAALLLAYVVFGITGFGATIIALPLVAQVVEIRFAVPLMLLMDLTAGALLGWRQRRHIDRGEMRRLLPTVSVGLLLGVTVLAQAPQRALLLTLGVFVLAVAAWSWLQRRAPTTISARWAAPAGAVGGAFTAMFGTGGPVYTAYLMRRIADAQRLRATVGTLIFVNAMARVVLFTATGLLLQPALLASAAVLLPCTLVGLAVGSRLHARLPPARVLQAVCALLALSGTGVLVRALAG